MTTKRILDVLVSILGLILLWPLFLLIALVVRLDSPGPASFCQVRCGRGGKPFRMYKFRTMHVGVPEVRNPDGSAFVGRGDPRLTGVGRWLREFGLDELPQLFNVLKGEMSLVGPRTIQPDQFETLSDKEKSIFLRMRPGITSLAQVSGRNSLDWEKRRELETCYVQNHSLWLDLRILLLTIPTVLFRRGVYNPDLTIGSRTDQRRGKIA